MKLMRIALTGSLLLVLAACGNDSPVNPPATDPGTDPGTPTTPGLPGFPGGGVPTTPVSSGISGTVTVSAGASASGAVVIACAQSDTQCASAQTTTADTAGAYSFINLQTTPYIVFAFQDVDGNQDLSTGDYAGFYSTDGISPGTVTPPATGINITMTVYDDGSGTPATPTDPGASGSISGTLLPPGTVVGDSIVFALYVTDEQSGSVDYDLSSSAAISAGSSFDYSVADLSAGQYYIVGYSDTDGNGSIEDAGDYVGVYSSVSTLETVSPPATGIDIPMITSSELDALSVQSTSGTARALEAARASLHNYLLKSRLEQALKALH